MEAFDEPTQPRPLPGGEQASVRVLSVPLSREGLGVGSWSQCMRKNEWRLSKYWSNSTSACSYEYVLRRFSRKSGRIGRRGRCGLRKAALRLPRAETRPTSVPFTNWVGTCGNGISVQTRREVLPHGHQSIPFGGL